MVAVGRGVVAAATMVVLVDVGVVVVAAGALDVDGARGVAVLEVEAAAVVDEGAVGGEEEVEFAAKRSPSVLEDSCRPHWSSCPCCTRRD